MTAKRITKPCPECGKSLHVDAVKCSCGWQDMRAAAKASRSERHACSAFGCPLPGTIYGGAQDREGWCCIHDSHRHGGASLQAITAAVVARQALFDGAYAMLSGVGLVEWWTQIPGKFARPFAARPDLLPTPDERKRTVSGWFSRVRSDLESEVLRDIGIDVRSGRKALPETRTYAPSEDDLVAAAQAESEIEGRTWTKAGDLLDVREAA